MRGALILLGAELVDHGRQGLLSLPRRGAKPDVRAALVPSLLWPVAVALLAYALPLLVIPQLGSGHASAPARPIPPLELNLATAAFALFGLFVGALLVHEQTLGENRLLLAYPITIRDLAQYRLWHTVMDAIKVDFYVVLPVLLAQLLLGGWPAGSSLTFICVCGCLLLALYLAAVVSMLWLCRLFRGTAPDRLFLGVFLASVWLLVIAKQVHEGPVAVLVAAVAAFASRGSLPAVLDRAGPGIAAAGVDAVVAVVALGVVLAATLEAAYMQLHRRGTAPGAWRRPVAGGVAALVRERHGYGRLARILRWLPAPTRAMVIKDVLSFWRRPYALLRIGMVVAVVALSGRLVRGVSVDPGALALYFVPAFVLFRLFIDSTGVEVGNASVVRLGFPNAAAYLSVRAMIAAVTGLVTSVVVWLASGTWLGGGLRVVPSRTFFVVMNAALSALLVTTYSLAFSTRRSSGLGRWDHAIHPAALALYWLLGPLVPGGLYLIDTAWIGHTPVVGWGIMTTIAALIVLIALPILWVVSARSLYRLLESIH